MHDRANVAFARDPLSSRSSDSSSTGGVSDELLFSAVGNRVNVFELTKHTSYTLPVECRSDIRRIAVSNSGALLIAVDEDGYAGV